MDTYSTKTLEKGSGRKPWVPEPPQLHHVHGEKHVNMAALMWARSRKPKIPPVSTHKVDLRHFRVDNLLQIDGGVVADGV